jgi:hypothetical protein
MNVLYLTGTDSRTFLQTLILLRSFADHMPGHSLKVCDFGLSPAERAFFDASGVALDDDGYVPGRPSWYAKARLGWYVPPEGWDAVVWIDCDMLVLRPFAETLAGIVEEMAATDQEVACSESFGGHTVGEFSRLHPNQEHFLGMLDRHATDLARPYLNSGFVVFRRLETLRRWAALVDSWPAELLFEQNAFNLLLYQRPEGVRLLDRRVWNVHDADLDRVRIGEAGATDEERRAVVIAHATSSRPGDLIEHPIHLAGLTCAFRNVIRLFGAEALRGRQVDVLGRALAESGPGLFGQGLIRRAESHH